MEIVKAISKFLRDILRRRNYTIRDSTLEFVSDFNEPLDDYYEIISRYPSLSFRTFMNPYVWGDFDQPLNLLPNLTTVNLGDSFNQQIVLTKPLKILSFEKNFNQHLTLSKNLLSLDTSYYFDQPIVLIKNLKILRFKGIYNKPLVLSKNLTLVRLTENFAQYIFLTKKIVGIIVCCRLNYIFTLPKHCTYVRFACFPCFKMSDAQIEIIRVHYDKSCLFYQDYVYGAEHMRYEYEYRDNLPNGLVSSISFGYSYERIQKMNNFPNDVMFVKCDGFCMVVRKNI